MEIDYRDENMKRIADALGRDPAAGERRPGEI
jgi:hypothetical protein